MLGDHLTLSTVMIVALASGLLLTAAVLVVGPVAVTVTYRLGSTRGDPTIPLVTYVCDVLGVLSLFGVATVVL